VDSCDSGCQPVSLAVSLGAPGPGGRGLGGGRSLESARGPARTSDRPNLNLSTLRLEASFTAVATIIRTGRARLTRADHVTVTVYDFHKCRGIKQLSVCGRPVHDAVPACCHGPFITELSDALAWARPSESQTDCHEQTRARADSSGITTGGRWLFLGKASKTHGDGRLNKQKKPFLNKNHSPDHTALPGKFTWHFLSRLICACMPTSEARLEEPEDLAVLASMKPGGNGPQNTVTMIIDQSMIQCFTGMTRAKC
jgi:hypothetical protein